MSELNEQVTVLVEDASVITVPIDTTLSNSGEAADAKAVGDALALKADASSVTGITVNGESADQQGAILIDGGDIPVSGNDATKLDVAIGALQDRDASDIIYDGAETIKEHVDELDSDVVHTSELTTPTAISPTINTTNLTLSNNDCYAIGSLVVVSIRATAASNIAARAYVGVTLPKPKNNSSLSSNASVCNALCTADNSFVGSSLLADGRIFTTDAISSGAVVMFTFAYVSTVEEIANFIPS